LRIEGKPKTNIVCFVYFICSRCTQRITPLTSALTDSHATIQSTIFAYNIISLYTVHISTNPVLYVPVLWNRLTSRHLWSVGRSSTYTHALLNTYSSNKRRLLNIHSLCVRVKKIKVPSSWSGSSAWDRWNVHSSSTMRHAWQERVFRDSTFEKRVAIFTRTLRALDTRARRPTRRSHRNFANGAVVVTRSGGKVTYGRLECRDSQMLSATNDDDRLAAVVWKT